MKIPITIKAARISAIAVIIAAIIGGVFSLTSSKAKKHIQTIKTNGNVEGALSISQETGAITINYNVPESATKDAIKELESKLNKTDEKVEFTKSEISLLARALKDLDQRTSGIEKLPDGRTKLGRFASGEPRIIIEEQNAAAHFFDNNDYQQSIIHSENAIKAYNDTKKCNISMSTGDITPNFLSLIYRVAALSSQMLNNREKANDYAQNAVNIDQTAINFAVLSTTQINVGKKEEALKNIDKALNIEPDNKDFIRLKKEYQNVK